MPPFTSVLVANRGEIAVRILRTIKRLGMRGVLVRHAADQGAPALALADMCVEITGATPIGAYLDGEQIIAAAKQTGVQAIHPGYGFLSENAAFARRVAQAGLVFVGPRPEAIELMGDKVRARAFVAKRGFPVAASAIEDDEPSTFLARSRALGAPLLIKPSAGGGGRGNQGPQARVFLDKHRGPGNVTFDNVRPDVNHADGGRVNATATFSAPGEYIVRVQVNDGTGEGGGGFQCCWTNGHVRVNVSAR